MTDAELRAVLDPDEVAELARLRAVLETEPDPATRPRSRQDCLPGGRNEQRPCRWGCWWSVPGGDRCGLDVIDAGRESREAIASAYDVSVARVRQIAERGMKKIRAGGLQIDL